MTTQKIDRSEKGRPQRSADSRYQYLAALARDGNEDAEGDLFREYGVQIPGQTHAGGEAVAS